MTVGMIRTQYLGPLWQGTKKAANHYANFVLGVEQSEAFSAALQKSVRGTKDLTTKKYVGGDGFNNFGTNFKNAWKSSKVVVENKSLWSVIKESFGKIPEEFAQKVAPEAKILGRTKGVLGILGKRMPLIGNLIYMATEIPNVWNAFTNPKGGVGTGLAEAGKVALKMGVFAAGAAIGQALIPIPFVGGIIGGIVGGWIADKCFGKSFTEQQEEAKGQTTASTPEAAAETQPQPAQAQTAAASGGYNPLAYNQSGLNPFAPQDSSMKDDFLAGQIDWAKEVQAVSPKKA